MPAVKATTLSTHMFHVEELSPNKSYPAGSRTDVFASQFPVLDGMALSVLHLYPTGVREPHWHPNANELSYCVEGKGIITIFSSGFHHDTFLIEPGTLSFIPKGSIHYVENIGDGDLRLLICFDNEQPEDLNLSSSVGVMPERILGATVDMEPTFFAKLNRTVAPTFIGRMHKLTKPELSWETNRFKMNIEEIHPQVDTRGGWVKMSNSFLFPALQGLSLYSLKLDKNGAREPHWHPNAHELNYLMSGAARITLLSPNGHVDTFDMLPGDMSFLPRGYLHHIENTGAEPARFAIFFNDPSPSDIGLSGCFGAYSNEVLASVFNVPASYFDRMPKFQEDRFVVFGAG